MNRFSNLATLQPEAPSVEVDAAWWVSTALEDYYSRVFAVTGGLGSGKTHGAAQWHFGMTVENQDCEFSWFIEPTAARIKDTAIPRWKKFFESIGYREGIHYTIKWGHPVEIRLPSGHKILFFSAHNPDFMVGAEISHFTIDEPGHTKYDAYLNCMSRMRDPKATRHQALLCGAPQGGGWFMDNFNFKGLDFGRRYRRFQIWTQDNLKYIGQNYIDQQMETYKPFPRKLRSYLKGEFVNFFEGACITDFNEETDVSPELVSDTGADLYLAWDFNAMPLAWVAFQILPFEYQYQHLTRHIQKYCVHGESSGLEASTVQDACAEFIKKFPPQYYKNVKLKIYGDRTGHFGSHKTPFTDYEQIEKYLKPFYDVELCATRKTAPQVESIEEVNRLFSYNSIVIHPRCVNFLKSLKQTKWKKGKREIDKPNGEDWSHWLDAFKYPVYQLIKLDILNPKREIIHGVSDF